jgi:hypothetical protein
MATIVALTSNNWSSTTVDDPWPGGTKPGAGDTVQTGDFIIEIDEDITVALLEATGVGYFTVTAIAGDGVRTITADVLNSGTVIGGLRISNPSGQVVTIGNFTGGTANSTTAVLNSGIMGSIVGNILGGADAGAGLDNSGTAGNITGNITGGAGSHGIDNSGTVGNITGDITGGAGGHGISFLASSVLGTITGDISGGSGSNKCGVYSYFATVGTIEGNVTGGTGDNAYGIYSVNTLPDVSGDVVGGSGNNACGIYIVLIAD